MSDPALPLVLAISIDVEEEGLFCGSYPRTPYGIENVSELRRLEFITAEFGIPLTLLVSYSVAVSPVCRHVLDYFRENLRAEIGAHLHPWNTPPFQDLPYAEPVRSDLLPLHLLKAKFETLLASIRDMGAFPQSFRMGRFDLGKAVCRLLPDYGLKVDSSVVPLRNVAGGPDHFLAPTDPFPLRLQTPVRELRAAAAGLPAAFGGREENGKRANVLEVPVTNVSLLRIAPRLVYRLAAHLPDRGRDAVFTGFRHIATAGIHPAWFPLESMKLAAALHRARGGKVLNMFLHSSELKPGATPSFRTDKAVDALVEKIRSFLTWLVGAGTVTGATLSELLGQGRFFHEETTDRSS